MISDRLICKESGQYDKEVLEHLNLEQQGIARIGNLNECTALLELVLARNEISNITGLDSVLLLRKLDLSFNKIKKVENLQHLAALEVLDLRGNQISDIRDIDHLSRLLKLKTLIFQGADGEHSNPICSHEQYYATILQNLPNLEILDGGHVKIHQSFARIQEAIAKVKPDASYCHTPPSEPWFTAKDKDPRDAFDESDVDSIINKTKSLNTVVELQKKMNDMLSEDCSHLVRKAQAAITKASK